jgi:hypothetical protein
MRQVTFISYPECYPGLNEMSRDASRPPQRLIYLLLIVWFTYEIFKDVKKQINGAGRGTEGLIYRYDSAVILLHQ